MTPKPGVKVRSARVEERDELVELQRRSSLDGEAYRAQLLAHPDAIDLPADHLARLFVRVATRDDRVVGFATVLPGPERTGELDGLFVEPGVMRQGIGRVLIEDAIAIAAAAGLEHILVTANPQALEFYEAVGFVAGDEVPTRFGPAVRMRIDLPR